MGITLNTAYMIMQEGLRRPFNGKILQMGKQDIYLTWEDLQHVARHMGYPLRPLMERQIQLNQKDWCIPRKMITDTTFFRALGFSEVVSMDYSAAEGADHIWDANNPVPREHYEKYDVVFDGGTYEHVFNGPNFLLNVCLMSAVGGRIIHETPSSGVIDHGFYSIQPTLYFDYYQANSFEINKLCVIRSDKDTMLSTTMEQIPYTPGMYDLHKTWAIDGKTYSTFCIATKRREFKTMIIPQQSLWARLEGAEPAQRQAVTANDFELLIYVPTYNRCERLKNCLTAISREIAGFEDRVLVYVSNNASTDGTAEYLQSLDHKWLRLRHNKENVGAPLNILHCFDLPERSEFVWPIGDDDYLLPNSISDILSLIKKYPVADYIFCNTKAFVEEQPSDILKKYFDTGSVEGGIAKSRKYNGTALIEFEQLIDPDIADTLLGELMVHCFRQSSIQLNKDKIPGLNSETADWDNLDFESAGALIHPHTLPFLSCFNRSTKAVYCDAPRTFNFWGSAEWLGNYDYTFPIGILFLISQYKERGFVSEDKYLSLMDYYYAIMGPSLLRQITSQSTARPFNTAIKEKMFEFLLYYMEKRKSHEFISATKARMFDILLPQMKAESGAVIGHGSDSSLKPTKNHTSIIILTLNQLDHTKLCLQSIEQHTPESHELIIVDNGSTDGTLDYLTKYASTHPSVRIISNKDNLGFAAGNNQGMTVAEGDFLLLLNNDTIVTEGWLGRMVSVFERYQHVGIVGPVSNNVSGPQQVKEANYDSLEKMHAFAKAWSMAHSGETTEFFRVVGFCLLVRREVIEKIGGLDEQFGSGNFEDDDFCLRAGAAGYGALIAKDSFVHHTGSQTFKGAKIDYQQSLERNWKIFKTKWKLPDDSPYGAYTISIETKDLSEYYIPLPSADATMSLIINALPAKEISTSGWSDRDRQFSNEYDHRLTGTSGTMPTNRENVPAGVTSELRPGLTSIIIATRNRLNQTKKCLRNIRNNTPESHEVILVDNGSTDGTGKWLQGQVSGNRNYHLVKNKKNVGRARGRNQGIKAAKGEFIVVMDDNVIVQTGWLESMLHCLNNAPDSGIVGPMPRTRNGLYDGADAYPSDCRPSAWVTNLKEQLSYRRTPYRNLDGACLLFRRTLATEIGLFDDHFDAGRFEDDDFCLRSAVAGHTNYLAGSIFIGRDAEESTAESPSSWQNNQKMFDEKWTGVDLRISLGKKVYGLGAIDKAQALHQKGELDQAVDTIIDGIRHAPDEKSLYYRLAEMLLDAKLYRDALGAIESMPSSTEDDLRRHEIVACCKQGLGESGDYVDQLLKADKGSPLGLNLMGMTAYKQGDHEAAEGFFREAIAADPGYGWPYTNLGVLKWASNRDEEALDYLEKGFMLSPTSTDSAELYHSAVTETEGFARAEDFVREAAAIHPESKRILFFLIDVLIKQRKYDAAMYEIEKAMLSIGVDDGILGAALEIRNRVGIKEIGEATKNKGTLSLCMIVKNEEQHLSRCLLSVKPVIDEMIVVDTGSTDRTKDIARVYGAKVYDFPWNDDFSAARNHSLSMAQGDWVLVLDADEVISPLDYQALNRIVRKKPLEPAGYAMVTRNYTNEVAAKGWTANDRIYRREEAGSGWFPSLKVRLFPNDKQIRFQNPVHELVEASLGRAGIEIKTLDIPVHHYGRFDTDKLIKKGKKYFLLGKQKFEEMQGDVRALKELAVQACELGEFEAGVELWKKIIDYEPNDAVAFLNISYAYLKLERYTEAWLASQKANELDPTMKEAALNYAGSEFIVGDINKAVAVLEKLLRDERDYPPAIALIAAAHYVRGRKKEGLELLEKLRKMGFNCTQFFNEQYRGVVSQGRFDQAALLLEAAVESGNVNEDTRHLVAEYQRKRNDCGKDEPESLRSAIS